MNVLGIVGSPHSEGNTAKLVEAVLEGAKEKGHGTEIFYLGDLEIEPLGADERRVTYPEDDMMKLYPHIESMGALVLGSPIYYDHVSARTKLFIDRLHYYSLTHGQEYRVLFPKDVKAVTIITYEWNNPDAYDDVVNWMNERLKHYWKMNIVGSLKSWSTSRKPVNESKELLEKANQMGEKL
jgi:multimeric flavodoxin WrbA